MDALEALLRPVTSLLNEQIDQSTPARSLCTALDGKTLAIQLNATKLAAYINVFPDGVKLTGDYAEDPEVIISGSLLSLASLLRGDQEAVIRAGKIQISGDGEVAEQFQSLLRHARPDIEEQLSRVLGDTVAVQLGSIARNVNAWAQSGSDTVRENIADYLTSERGELPARADVETFFDDVDSVRDAVARAEARLNLLTERTQR